MLQLFSYSHLDDHRELIQLAGWIGCQKLRQPLHTVRPIRPRA